MYISSHSFYSFLSRKYTLCNKRNFFFLWSITANEGSGIGRRGIKGSLRHNEGHVTLAGPSHIFNYPKTTVKVINIRTENNMSTTVFSTLPWEKRRCSVAQSGVYDTAQSNWAKRTNGFAILYWNRDCKNLNSEGSVRHCTYRNVVHDSKYTQNTRKILNCLCSQSSTIPLVFILYYTTICKH